MADYPIAPKWAVYYGTIILSDGSSATYTAAQVATFYNLGSDTYLAVPLSGPTPFHGGFEDPMGEITFYHLKPQPDGQYYDAHVRYNTTGGEYFDIDFDAHSKDRWVHRPRFAHDLDDI